MVLVNLLNVNDHVVVYSLIHLPIMVVDMDVMYQEMLLTLTKVLFLKRYVVEELMCW